MRRLAIGFAALLALIAVVLGVVLGRVDWIVVRAVDRIGPQITGTPVSVGRAHISIFSGDGALHDLKVGNPSGFTTPEAFTLGSVAVGLELKSLAGEVVHVRSIVIEAPQFTAEYDAQGRINLNELLAHARGVAQATPGHPAGKSEGTERKLMVDVLRVANAQVRVLAPAFGLDRTLTLRSIELKNLGSAQHGLSAADLAAQVLQPVIGAVLETAAGEVLKARGGDLLNRLLKH